MPRMTNRELLEENEVLRSKLENIYDQIGDALGFEDEEDADEESDEEDNEE